MNGGLEANLLQDHVGLFFPEPWGLGMTLHRGEDWDDMTVRDWRVLFVVDPPFMKGSIWTDKETLLWQCPFVGCSDCKVVNLWLEDNMLAGDDSRI